MKRPSYGAVTGVTAFLAVVCVFRMTFIDLIPPPNPEIGKTQKGEYVARASAQPIKWRTSFTEAYAESRRLSRPLLVSIGVPWSMVGRQSDASFAMPSVARAIDRSFIPLRLDGAHDPRWISAFLPLQRAEIGFSTGFQIWVLDSRGRLVDFIGRVNGEETMDENHLIDALVQARELYRESLIPNAPLSLEATQWANAARLTEPSVAQIDLPNAANQLIQAQHPEFGLWSMRGLIQGTPFPLAFLQTTGRVEQAETGLMRVAASPQFDWLDGGVYRILHESTHAPEFDKVLPINAAWAETFALQDALRPNAVLRQCSKDTVAWLLTGIEDGFFCAAELGDEEPNGRSLRASFPVSHLQGIRNEPIADWINQKFEFDPNRNPHRVLVPQDLETVRESANLAKARTALRKVAGPARKRAGERMADANGYTIARLLSIARLWNSRVLGRRVGDLVDRMEAFRRGDDIIHLYDRENLPGAYANDYLAYADAMLGDFLTNDRVPSLDRGTRVLRRAMQVFLDPTTGVFRQGALDPNVALPEGLRLPNVTDDEREATSAMAIRLTLDYAHLLGPSASDLLRSAKQIANQSGASIEAKASAGATLAAIAREIDDRALIVVGPAAPKIAARLRQLRPTRLVLPVSSSLRPDLLKRTPGVYVEALGGLAGPFTEAQVLNRVPSARQVGT